MSHDQIAFCVRLPETLRASYRQHLESVLRPLLQEPAGGLFLYYEDHWIRDLFLTVSKENLIFNCCDPWLLSLLQGKTEKTELAVRILYYYLYYDSKITLVSEHLHMHRNNVIYHIKQLEAHYGINLSDPEVRLKARFSLEALRCAGIIRPA